MTTVLPEVLSPPRLRGYVENAYAVVLGVRTRWVLAGLLAVQWLALLGFVLKVRHNGWLFYQGGDEIWLYGSAWVLAKGHIPFAVVSYGWPVLLAPIALLAGPLLATALPAIVLLQVLVLLPVALLCVYGIASRIGGRLFGYWAAALWIAVPFIGTRYADTGYRQKYTELFLPQAYGLTAMADFVSMVALLVAAYFTIRILERDEWIYAAAAGLALATAIGIKPANAIFAPAPLLALLLARRWRAFVPYALALAPALVTLAVWKLKGTGQIPAFAAGEPQRLALPAGDVLAPVHRYVNLDWNHFQFNLDMIREHFWSLRLVEFAPLAGTIALLRRSLPITALLAGWFWSFAIVKGTYVHAGIEDGSLLRLMLPAAPALLLLIAALPFLIPGVAERARGAVERAEPPSRRTAIRLLAAAAVVFALLPLVAVAAATPQRGPKLGVTINGLFAGIDPGLHLTAQVTPDGVRLRWNSRRPAGTPVFYRVVRTEPGDSVPKCDRLGSSSDRCSLGSEVGAPAKDTSYLDDAPSGLWTYRIAVAGNWLNDPQYGDIFVVSRPVTVDVP